MRLTLHTDYSLRVLLYLATRQDERVKLKEVSSAYGISYHHLVKVVQGLVEHGYVETIAGRNGGMWLAKDPQQINIGDVVERMEPDFALVACMGGEGGCVITPVCALKHALADAKRAFLDVLRAYHLADVVQNRSALLSLLNAS